MKQSVLALVCVFFLTGFSQKVLASKVFVSPHAEGELIVTFDQAASKEEIERAVSKVGGVILHKFKTNSSFLIKIKNLKGELFAAGEDLLENSVVQFVAPNRIFTINETNTPNDPLIDRQYHHQNMESRKAWEISKGSKEVVTAVIDTGVNYNHPDLIENYWINEGEAGLDEEGNDKRSNGIDDDGNGYIDDFRGWDFVDDDNDPMDPHGHGTHCAGTIAARGNNGVGITGINWLGSVVGLRFISSDGRGTEAAAIKAIEYATMMGFDLTSNSWGGTAPRTNEKDLLRAAIEAADEAGILFVAASGNSGADIDKVKVLPAGYDLDNIISVGSSTNRDGMSWFSNYGLESVDLLAPGSQIFSTTKKNFFGREYGAQSGTSMAAPMVAGAVALLKAHFTTLSHMDIKNKILDSVDPLEGKAAKTLTGGRLNLYKALSQ